MFFLPDPLMTVTNKLFMFTIYNRNIRSLPVVTGGSGASLVLGRPAIVEEATLKHGSYLTSHDRKKARSTNLTLNISLETKKSMICVLVT